MRELVTVSMQELDRLKCIQAVVEGDLKPIRAAERLGLTSRQFRRLVRRYEAEGSVGLVPKSISWASSNRLDDTLTTEVIKILRSTYADFGPKLASEKLRTKQWHRFGEEDGPSYVDETTSRLRHILFTGNESTVGYFEATHQYFVRHGKPLAFYGKPIAFYSRNLPNRVITLAPVYRSVIAFGQEMASSSEKLPRG